MPTTLLAADEALAANELARSVEAADDGAAGASFGEIRFRANEGAGVAAVRS